MSGKIPLDVFRANCEDDRVAKKLHQEHQSRQVLQAAVNSALGSGPN